MSYDAQVLADSISPDGVRLTTLMVTFPRFILAEVNTHRMLSRNSASSRAIPTEKIIERVQSDPFIPETFNKRVKGMGVGASLAEKDMAEARKAWLFGRDKAVLAARVLVDLDVDKSRANRLLEPFMWHTAIISATEWDNFFALRDHEAAQPEFRITAQAMKEAMAGSLPVELEPGQWHLPMITDGELKQLCDLRQDPYKAPEQIAHELDSLKLISAGRLARVSFDTHELMEPHADSIQRAQRLMGNGHFSPFEHVARPAEYEDDDMSLEIGEDISYQTFFGNFRGWVQMRKEIPHESRFDMLQRQA